MSEENLKQFEEMLGISCYGDNVAIKNKNGGCLALANVSSIDKTR